MKVVQDFDETREILLALGRRRMVGGQDMIVDVALDLTSAAVPLSSAYRSASRLVHHTNTSALIFCLLENKSTYNLGRYG